MTEYEKPKNGTAPLDAKRQAALKGALAQIE
jgi:hypothetical protein